MADMVTLAVKLTPPQYRAYLEAQELPKERIDRIMGQVQVQDGFVVSVPSADLAPPASYVPAGVQEPDQSKLEKIGGKVKEKLGDLKAKINEKINEMEKVGQEVPAQMMRKTARFKYLGENDFQALELPYVGDRLSMVVYPTWAPGAAMSQTKTGNRADFRTGPSHGNAADNDNPARHSTIVTDIV